MDADRAESERLDAEYKRLKAEIKRKDAEIKRKGAELKRLDAMKTRVVATFGIMGEMLEMVEKSDLEDLMLPGHAGEEARTRMHDIMIRGLDNILADGRRLYLVTGYAPEEFRQMLDEFTREIMNDERRPLLRDGPGGHDKGRCKMKPEHLLLMVLFHARVGPEQTGMAAAFNTDIETAAGNLGYAMSAYLRVVESPRGISARLMDALDRGAYGEVERELPGLALFITRTRIPCELPGDAGDRMDILMGMVRKGSYDELFVSGGRHIIGAGEAPPASTGPEALQWYMSGAGGFLERLTRPLPDGRRWTIVAGAGFPGLDKLLPWADVVTTHKKHRRRAVSLEQREQDRMITGGRKSAEQMAQEIKKHKLACGPGYDNFGTGEMLQLIAGMVNSHIDWNAGGDHR